jgi:polyhydroxybutyrate depolymerase
MTHHKVVGLSRSSFYILRRAGAVLALGACVAAVPVALADGDGSGIAKGIAQTMAAAQKMQQQIQAAFNKIIGQSGGTLGGTLQKSIDAMELVIKESNPNYIAPTPGTAIVNETLTWQGVSRSYTIIRPEPANDGAPVLVLMHAHGISPSTMANLARAGRLAQDYGVWVVLPKGENGTWNEDPSSMSSTDDVGFISAMIDKLSAEYAIDTKRVYAAGYSAGGFMAERLACQLSSKIAGFAAVAATLRNSLAAAGECTPSHEMPAVFMDGTADAVVPYNGEPSVQSATAATAFWGVKNGCSATDISTTTLPQQTKDGTTVALSQFTDCPAGGAAELYTINGGGHTWPDSPYSAYTSYLGKTSKNLDATVVLWQFLTPYALN